MTSELAGNNTLNATQTQRCNVPKEFANGQQPPPSDIYNITEFIWKILPPILIITGTFGNTLTVIVIVRRFRKISSTSCFLLALAFSDTCLLFTAPLRGWIKNTWKLDVRAFSEPGCKVSLYLTYASMQLSSWLLVAVTVERTFSVLWPHRVKIIWTPKVSLVVIAVISVVILGLNTHFFYGWGIWLSPWGVVYPCEAIIVDYKYFFNNMWSWIDFFMAFAVPFVCLLIGNSIIIYKLWKAHYRRKSMSGVEGEDRNDAHSSESKTITVMLVFLNIIFLICLTPVSIYYIYIPYVYEEITQELFCKDPFEFIRRRDVAVLVHAITNALSFINASINFFLYVLSGTKFRTEVIALLCCRGLPRSNTYRSRSGTTRGTTVSVTSSSGSINPKDT